MSSSARPRAPEWLVKIDGWQAMITGPGLRPGWTIVDKTLQPPEGDEQNPIDEDDKPYESDSDQED